MKRKIKEISINMEELRSFYEIGLALMVRYDNNFFFAVLL